MDIQTNAPSTPSPGVLWEGNGKRYRVRMGGSLAGGDPLEFDDLLHKLLAVREADGDIDQYAKNGLAARFAGQDADGTPFIDVGDMPADAPADKYAALDHALESLKAWGARRPVFDGAMPHFQDPSLDTREALLSRLRSAPQFDESGAASRSLESGLVGGALARLLGGSGRVVGAAFRGAAGGAGGALRDRFGREVQDWGRGVAADQAAVKLSDERTAAGNRNALLDWQARRDAHKLDEAGWVGEGRALEGQVKNLLAELSARSRDDAQAERARHNTAQEGESSRHNTAREEDADLDRQDRREVNQSKQESEAQKAKTGAEKARLDRLQKEADGLSKSLSSGRLSARDRIRVRSRLAEIKKFADVGPGDVVQDEPGLSPGERQRAGDAAAGRAIRRSAGGTGLDPGPKAGPVEKWRWLADEHGRLRQEHVDAKKRLDDMSALKKQRPLSESEDKALSSAMTDERDIWQALQSRTNELAKLEAQYPEIKSRAGLSSRSVKARSGRSFEVVH